jgi:putative transcriptional regulator
MDSHRLSCCRCAYFVDWNLSSGKSVTRQTFIAIENDKYNPSLELAMKIAELLKLHVDEIFFLDHE